MGLSRGSDRASATLEHASATNEQIMRVHIHVLDFILEISLDSCCWMRNRLRRNETFFLRAVCVSCLPLPEHTAAICRNQQVELTK
jgi:hypothetical protein